MASPVPVGISLWGQQPDAAAYRLQILEWARQIRSLSPWPHALMVETWARLNEGAGDFRREVPHNLPESDWQSHTGLVLQIADLFQEVS